MLKKIVILFFFSLFIIPVIKILSPQDINYTVYLFFITALATLVNLSNRKFSFQIDAVVLYLLLFIFLLIVNKNIFRDYLYFLIPSLTLSLYYFIVKNGDEENEKYFIKIFIIVSFIQAFLSITQSIFGLLQFEIYSNAPIIFESDRNYLAYLFPTISTYVRQGYGTFEHFNGLAALLSLAAPLSYALLKQHYTKNNKFTFIVIFLGQVTTFSRGGLLGSIIGILFIEYHSSKSKLWKISIVVFPVILILILLPLLSQYFLLTENLTSRENTWVFTINYALQSPFKVLVGFGPFFFVEKFLGAFGTINNLHSGQLQILLEMGILGFFFVIYATIKGVKSAITSKHISLLGYGGAVIAFFSHQIFDNSFFALTSIIYFSLIGYLIKNRHTNIYEK